MKTEIPITGAIQIASDVVLVAAEKQIAWIENHRAEHHALAMRRKTDLIAEARKWRKFSFRQFKMVPRFPVTVDDDAVWGMIYGEWFEAAPTDWEFRNHILHAIKSYKEILDRLKDLRSMAKNSDTLWLTNTGISDLKL